MPKTLRSSRRREAIHRFVAAHGGHPSADEILAGLRKQIPGAGLATVYRNLDILVGLKRLSRTVHDGVARYDACAEPHHHFVCERCGGIRNVEMDMPKAVIRDASRRSRASISSAAVEFRGVCARCKP